jgi:hypothetical protein
MEEADSKSKADSRQLTADSRQPTADSKRQAMSLQPTAREEPTADS